MCVAASPRPSFGSGGQSGPSPGSRLRLPGSLRLASGLLVAGPCRGRPLPLRAGRWCSAPSTARLRGRGCRAAAARPAGCRRQCLGAASCGVPLRAPNRAIKALKKRNRFVGFKTHFVYVMPRSYPILIVPPTSFSFGKRGRLKNNLFTVASGCGRGPRTRPPRGRCGRCTVHRGEPGCR